jgi:hypothetical protein
MHKYLEVTITEMVIMFTVPGVAKVVLVAL